MLLFLLLLLQFFVVIVDVVGGVSVVIVVIIVVINPRDQPIKFGRNHISNRWDIADVEFPVEGGWWWWCKVIFVSNPTLVMLGWVVVGLGFWQKFDLDSIIQVEWSPPISPKYYLSIFGRSSYVMFIWLTPPAFLKIFHIINYCDVIFWLTIELFILVYKYWMI